MQITLTFTDDQEDEAKLAMNGAALSYAVDEVGEKCFRQARKHGYTDDRLNEIIAHLDALCEANASPENLYVGELISLLETRFWTIINESRQPQ